MVPVNSTPRSGKRSNAMGDKSPKAKMKLQKEKDAVKAKAATDAAKALEAKAAAGKAPKKAG